MKNGLQTVVMKNGQQTDVMKNGLQTVLFFRLLIMKNKLLFCIDWTVY